MCRNQTNSVSIAMLSIPFIFFTSTVLNITFLVRHWSRFEDLDQQILRSISIVLMIFGFMINAFVAFIFTQQTITRLPIRLFYIFVSSLGLGQLYLYIYQKSDKFGLRLKSVQYKLAVVNFSVDLSSFIFNYSMLYIIYLPFYKQLFIQFSLKNIDTITVMVSPIVVVLSTLMVFLKGICLMCFEEEEGNWFKRLFFMGICCCDWLQCAQSRKYYQYNVEESDQTDY